MHSIERQSKWISQLGSSGLSTGITESPLVIYGHSQAYSKPPPPPPLLLSLSLSLSLSRSRSWKWNKRILLYHCVLSLFLPHTHKVTFTMNSTSFPFHSRVCITRAKWDSHNSQQRKRKREKEESISGVLISLVSNKSVQFTLMCTLQSIGSLDFS